MKIYLVKTQDSVGYDMHDAIVVIAKNPTDAVLVARECCTDFGFNLIVDEIGFAYNDKERGEVLSSYNPG